MLKTAPSVLMIALIATATLAGGTANAQAGRNPGQGGSSTVNLQGPTGVDQMAAMRSNPYMRELYGVSVIALAGGPAKVDLNDFEARFFAVARRMAAETGGDPDAIQDHLKLIPGQIVQIVTEDPRALDSFDNFALAMVGPP
jgi:hypothetical protein